MYFRVKSSQVRPSSARPPPRGAHVRIARSLRRPGTLGLRMLLRHVRQRVVAVTAAAASGAVVAASVQLPSSCQGTHSDRRRIQVLVTGFNDWKNLGETPNLWRCRDNPSCRLLVGPACASPPLSKQGGLARRLRQCTVDPDVEIEWHFQTLTTQWQTAATLDHLAFDVVVNVGLGVYDGSKELRVEQGAHNSARGTDAAGHKPRSNIQQEGMPEVLTVKSMAPNTTVVDGLQIGEYRVVAVNARKSNSYICNDTHYRALRALQHSEDIGGKLQAVFFIHIPPPGKQFDPACEADYEPLAAAMASLVHSLVLHAVRATVN